MKHINIFLLSPRGFCAGVKRAIDILDAVSSKYKEEIYVVNDIVHNERVVNYFRNKGIKFVKNIEEVACNSVVVFSAHGVSEATENLAKERNLQIIDASCPLVKKVHTLAIEARKKGKKLIVIGHANHPEVQGTIGRVDEAFLMPEHGNPEILPIGKNEPVACVTQTTLCSKQVSKAIERISSHFPNFDKIHSGNVCYATTNRQDAVRSAAHLLDVLLVVGSHSSSNSNRLREIGEECELKSYLIHNPADVLTCPIQDNDRIGITAGASTPSESVEETLLLLNNQYKTNIQELHFANEQAFFPIPKDLRKT